MKVYLYSLRKFLFLPIFDRSRLIPAIITFLYFLCTQITYAANGEVDGDRWLGAGWNNGPFRLFTDPSAGCIYELTASNFAGFSYNKTTRVYCQCYSNPGADKACSTLSAVCPPGYIPSINGGVGITYGCTNLNGTGEYYCPVDSGWPGGDSKCVLPTGGVDKRKNLGPSCPHTRNPINPALGNKYLIEADYGSVNAKLDFVRTYNSDVAASAFNGTMGSNWQHNFERKILFTPSTSSAFVYRSDGKIFIFSNNNPLGIWQSDADITSSLEQLSNNNGWRYTNIENGDVELYDSTGKIISITKTSGYSQSLTYSVSNSSLKVLDANGNPTSTTLPAGLLISVLDSFGRQLSFGYDSNNRVVKMTAPNSGVYLYGYDANNNLASVRYPDSRTRAYIYNEPTNAGTNLPNSLTGIVDENGNRFATYKYDSLGRAIASEHEVWIPGESTPTPVEQVSVAYTTNTGGNAATSNAITSAAVTEVIDANLSPTTTYAFTNILGVVKNTSSSQPCSSSCGAASATTYDVNGNVSSRMDFNGNQTTYQYDLTRNLETSRTEGLTSSGATTPQTRTITTQWHPTYRLPTLITEPGKTTAFSYDTSGNLLSKTITDTALNKSRTWSYTYNSLGQVLTADGPRTDVSDVTTYTYYTSASNTSGSVHSIGDLATVTNAVGLVTSITNYDLNGRPLSITDPNGVVTTLTYSPRGWLTSRTVNGVQTTNYQYDGVGQLTKVTLPDGSYLNYIYDTAHRLTDITDNQNNKIEYSLDAMGNRTADAKYDPSGNLMYGMIRVFDALNRLQQTIGIAGSSETTQYAYDNNSNLKTITDPLNHVTTNGYDALNRLITVTDPANGVTTTNYNALDQITSVSDPRLVTTNYTIDGLGNVTLTQSPDSGNTNNVYDAAGNVIQKTDALGIVSTYTYDALNRLTSITYPASTSENVTFTYDDTTTTYYRKGRLKSLATNSSTSTLTFSYDAYGNIVSQADLSSAMWGVSSYQYDSANRVSQITYPSGRIVIYTRNTLGQITQVQTKDNASAALQTIISSASYEPFGPLNSLSFYNGVTTTIQHDFDYRVGRITTTSTPTWDYAYSYDAASNLTGMADQIGTVNKTYGYDTLNRLTTDTSGTTSFTYHTMRVAIAHN